MNTNRVWRRAVVGGLLALLVAPAFSILPVPSRANRTSSSSSPTTSATKTAASWAARRSRRRSSISSRRGRAAGAFYVQPVCSPTRARVADRPLPDAARAAGRRGAAVGAVRAAARRADAAAGSERGRLRDRDRRQVAPRPLPPRVSADGGAGSITNTATTTARIDYFTHIRDGGFDWHKDDKVNRDEGYSTHLIAKEAERFVEGHRGRKPFFLYVPFNAVHAPHQVPDSYMKPYAASEGAAPEVCRDARGDGRGGRADRRRARRRRACAKNTLFVFSSDNGGPQPGNVTDNGKLPRRQGNAVRRRRARRRVRDVGRAHQARHDVTEPMHMVDWYPTLVKLAGAGRTETAGGRTRRLADDRRGQAVAARCDSPQHDSEQRCDSRGDWKLVERRPDETDNPDGVPPKKKTADKEGVELFNLEDDPYEKTNLADKHPDKSRGAPRALRRASARGRRAEIRARAADFQVPKVWGEQ